MPQAPDIPIIPSARLPVAELRAPMSPREQRTPDEPAQPSQADIHRLCELLEPAISAAIARKARQRRYTP